MGDNCQAFIKYKPKCFLVPNHPLDVSILFWTEYCLIRHCLSWNKTHFFLFRLFQGTNPIYFKLISQANAPNKPDIWPSGWSYLISVSGRVKFPIKNTSKTKALQLRVEAQKSNHSYFYCDQMDADRQPSFK